MGGLISDVYSSKHWWFGSYVQDFPYLEPFGSPKVSQYHYLSDNMTTLIYTVEIAQTFEVL